MSTKKMFSRVFTCQYFINIPNIQDKNLLRAVLCKSIVRLPILHYRYTGGYWLNSVLKI